MAPEELTGREEVARGLVAYFRTQPKGVVMTGDPSQFTQSQEADTAGTEIETNSSLGIKDTANVGLDQLKKSRDLAILMVIIIGGTMLGQLFGFVSLGVLGAGVAAFVLSIFVLYAVIQTVRIATHD